MEIEISNYKRRLLLSVFVLLDVLITIILTNKYPIVGAIISIGFIQY